MHLEMTDDETAALIKELNDIVESDRHPFSPRIRTLRTILAKLDPPAPRPEPPRSLNAGAAPDVGCGRWRR